MSDSTENTPINEINLGKHWAALRGKTVVGVISMRVPYDVDFDDYRGKAIACLELIGDVKSGEVVIRSGHKIFVQRLTHANRGKSPRTPKEYLMRQ